LRLRPETLADRANPSFVARRLQHREFAAYTSVDVQPQADGDIAGLAVYHSDDNHIRFEVSGVGRRVVRVVRRLAGAEDVVGECGVDTPTVRLAVEGRRLEGRSGQLEFRVADVAGGWHLVGQVDAIGLSASVAGGFFGVVIGLFATSSGATSTVVADFDWFEYTGVSA